MDKIELDKEIALTKDAVEDLTESKSYEALKLAQADLSYFISLLHT